MLRGEIFQIVPGQTDVGAHVFSVIVKRSYRVTSSGRCERLEADHPLRLIDEYYDDGDPETSTVRHESEVAPYKTATDVVVVGKAYAPGKTPTQHMRVGIRVGATQKVLAVTGDRHCHYRENELPVFTEPTPFTEMELRYERAYGGRDDRSIPEIPFIYPRNAMGSGVVLRNVKEAVDGLRLPNIEDPQDLLTPDRLLIEEPERWHLQPIPEGFGWRQRSWYPRSALIGSYPPFLEPGVVTPEERMGLLPPDHVALAKQSRYKPEVARFGNGASLGLVVDGMRGDEAVTLVGLTESGRLTFSLPGERPRMGLDIGQGEQELQPALHTVSIRSEDLEVDLIWRGSCEYPGYAWLPKMTRLHADVQ